MTGRRRADASQRNAATCLALSVLVACALGLIAFTAVILPQIRGALLVIAGLSVFILLHYLTWGRWMSRLQEPDDDPVPPVPDEH